MLGLSLIAVNGGSSSLWGIGLSLGWHLLWQSTGSRHLSFNSCSTQAQQLWYMGLVAPTHVESSRPGIEPVSPALASRFLFTVTLGKPPFFLLICNDRPNIKIRATPPQIFFGVLAPSSNCHIPSCFEPYIFTEFCNF